MLDPRQWNAELRGIQEQIHRLESELRGNKLLDAYDRILNLYKELERLRDTNSQPPTIGYYRAMKDLYPNLPNP